MRICTFDLSLTATGHASRGCTMTLHAKNIDGPARLIHLREHVRRLLWPEQQPTLVVLEGYAYGMARGNAMTALGELGGVVRVLLHELEIPWLTIAPAQLKKYATGKGNGSKDLVLAEAVKRSGDTFDGDNNRADAWWLYQMAACHYGQEHVPMPASHREVLAKIDWPTF